MAHAQPKSLAISSFISHYAVQRPVDWSQQFGNRNPLELEIGFGLGDFLIPTAQTQQDKNFVGLELDWPRVKKTLQKIKDLQNVRILQVDATVALERLFEPRQINRVYSLFPCPWPKEKHIKHRIFSRNFFRLLNSRLRDKGEVTIVTDFLPYFEWMRDEVKETGFTLNEQIIAPRFNTKYERKWCAQGQNKFYELTLIKNEHYDIPVQEDVPLKVYFVEHFDASQFAMENLTGGEVSVIFKNFVHDAQQQCAMAHLVVAEASITQHLWVSIAKTNSGWCIAKAEGHTALPTPGVALALRHMVDCVQNRKIVS